MLKRLFASLLAVAILLCACALSENTAAYDDRLTVVAAIGDESRFVYVVEQALFEKGYLLETEVDGFFDEYTEMAVMNFQAYKGYEVDGLLTKVQFYWLSSTYYMDWFDSSYIVYITENGNRYHTWDCSKIAKSYSVMPISTNVALDNGYLPCRICNPWFY